MNETTQILPLLGLLYDVALDTNKWEPFLQSCCDAFTSDCGNKHTDINYLS